MTIPAERTVQPAAGAFARAWLAVMSGLIITWMPQTIVTAQGTAGLETDELQFFEAEARAIASAVERVGDAVVSIEVVGVSEQPGAETAADAPTAGTVIGEDGWIIASSQVVERDAASILVVLESGERLPARVVSRDVARELVLLKVDPATPLPAVNLPATMDARVGDYAIAVGRVSSQGPAARSVGIVSALSRLKGRAMQTDARISPPFYGGPLIDIRGNILGIVVPAMPEAGGAGDKSGWYDSGIAFVAPVDQIVPRLESMRSGDDIRSGKLGIVAGSRDPLADGTKISAVRVGSPASQAGMEPGDVITAVNGIEVTRHSEISEVLGPIDAGTEVVVTIQRGDEEKEIRTTLVAEIPPFDPQSLGVLLESSSEGEGQKGLTVKAVFADSPAAAAGLQVGDVITTVLGDPVGSIEEFRKRVMTLPVDGDVTFSLERDGVSMESTWTSTSFADQWPVALPEFPEVQQGLAWEVSDLQLPDVENKAAMLAPAEGTEVDSIGLLVVFAKPGDEDVKVALNSWLDDAKSNRVIVAMIGSKDPERWNPDEAELASRVASMITKRYSIEPFAVSVSGEGPGGTMAIIAAFSDSTTFSGFSVAADVKPPAVQLRENDPSSPLHVLIQRMGEDLPAWSKLLNGAGYAVVDDVPGREATLKFVWALGRI